MQTPIIFAHRGASARAPENTLAAFKTAMDLGAGGIELDVHLSHDGRVVVIHDEKVNRTSNGKGHVKDLTLDKLKQLDFGSWFGAEFTDERIPTLEEVLGLLQKWNGILNIELKTDEHAYKDIEQKTIDLIKKYNMGNRIIISSFNHKSLVEIKKLAPAIQTAILYMSDINEPWEYAKKIGAGFIHPPYHRVTPKIIEGCRMNHIKVSPFTVDDPKMIAKMAKAGVFGIITNVPDEGLAVIKI